MLKRLDRRFIYILVAQMLLPIEFGYVYFMMVEDALRSHPFINVYIRYTPLVVYCFAQTIILLVGLACFLRRVHRRAPGFHIVVWAWIILEACNGGFHFTWAALWWSYVPGLLSSMLLTTTLVLMVDEMRDHGWKHIVVTS